MMPASVVKEHRLPMGQYAKQLKNVLAGLISDMAECPSLWSRNPASDFRRSRKIPFASLVCLLLSAGGNSLNKELYDYFHPRGMHVTASAFVQQRGKLLPEALEDLLHAFNRVCRDEKQYKGYRLLAVDGCTMTYARDLSQDTFMPKSGTDGVNQFHVNALYDLLNKTYADVIIQPKPEANEPKAAWQMMERLSLFGKTILTADRGYGGINLIEHVRRIPDVDYLIRIKNGLWKEMRDLPMADFDTCITIRLRTTQTNADRQAYEEGDAKWIAGHGKHGDRKQATWDFESPYEVPVRIVRFRISDNGEDRYETIATSLPKEEFPPSVLKYLYHLCWGIETSFRELKYAIGVTNFHAKKHDSVLQEILARIIMYNFCERITLHVVISQSAGRKWDCQANYTMGIHICRAYFRAADPDPPDPEPEIAQYVLPIRPNRADRRKVAPKQAVYFTYRIA